MHRSRSRSTSGERGGYSFSRPGNNLSSFLVRDKSIGLFGLSAVTGLAFGAGSEVVHGIVHSVTGDRGHSFIENQ